MFAFLVVAIKSILLVLYVVLISGGIVLGIRVGVLVGLNVGMVVGIADGSVVGIVVGMVVGSLVHIPHLEKLPIGQSMPVHLNWGFLLLIFHKLYITKGYIKIHKHANSTYHYHN